MTKEQEAIAILNGYADDLRRKGIKFPKPKDDKQLASLVVSFLEAEYRVEDETLNHHQKTSTMNISAFDKRFMAAQTILQRETKKEDLTEYQASYVAYDNDGNMIVLESSIRRLTKKLQSLFKSKHKITEHIIYKAIKVDNLNFKWGSIKIND